jgi:hypothetical protein
MNVVVNSSKLTDRIAQGAIPIDEGAADRQADG